MTKAKKKLLPKNFDDLLKDADVAAIKAVFLTCDLNARGNYSKQCALAFSELPDDVARWLVAEGADIAAVDSHGRTPLHARAGHWQGNIDILLKLGADAHARDEQGNTPLHRAAETGNVRTARILVQHGARIDATNSAKLTPLELVLRNCTNAKLSAYADIAELLLNAKPRPQAGFGSLVSRLFGKGRESKGVPSTDMKAAVARIGANFEFHRENFNPDGREEASAALDKLYVLFDVPPAPRRLTHDGKSLILMKSSDWEGRHQELWELLVPSSGAATTVQGEVVRISGRINRELEGNGGINWNPDFKLMADALLTHLASGNPLSKAELKEAKQIVSEIKRKYGDTQRLSELAVDWVVMNPEPVALPTPAYHH